MFIDTYCSICTTPVSWYSVVGLYRGKHQLCIHQYLTKKKTEQVSNNCIPFELEDYNEIFERLLEEINKKIDTNVWIV